LDTRIASGVLGCPPTGDSTVFAEGLTAGRILTVLWNGDVLPLTPDFATVPKADLHRFVIGNLRARAAFREPASSDLPMVGFNGLTAGQ